MKSHDRHVISGQITYCGMLILDDGVGVDWVRDRRTIDPKHLSSTPGCKLCQKGRLIHDDEITMMSSFLEDVQAVLEDAQSTIMRRRSEGT